MKQARVAALLEAQQAVAFESAENQVGKQRVAVVDGPDPEFANTCGTGRWRMRRR